MEQAAEIKGIKCKIDAMSVNAFEEAIKEYDVCLLGPQVRFQLEELRKTAQEYGKISMRYLPSIWNDERGRSTRTSIRIN